MAIGNMRETRVLCEVVLSDREGKILILRRSSSDKRRPGQWDVPGGHLDPDEHSEYKWVNLEQAIDLIEYDLQVEALTYIRDNNLLEMD
jgi:8-oxo-dGTP pyrophosphatase MutT (NUDIX family)